MLENFRTQKIIWDRANKKIFEKIEANSGDSNGRKLVVQVINQEATEGLSGTTLSLGWKSRKGAKGLDAFKVVDASKGIFEIYYTTEMLSNIGNIEASLILIDSTSRIESSTFTISVRPSTVDDESVESENSFTALTEALVKVNDFDAQLAQTVKKTDTLSMSQLGQDVKEAMTGGSVAVVGKDAVNTVNIIDKAVTADKTDFMITSDLNMFNEATSLKGRVLNYNLGTIIVNAGWQVSDYIYAEPNTQYTSNHTFRYAEYDANDTFVSGNADIRSFISSPQTTKFRITFPIDVIDFIISKGSDVPVYQDYNQIIGIKGIDVSGDVDLENLKGELEYEKSINLYETISPQLNKVMNTLGVIADSTAYNLIGIPVSADEVYTVSRPRGDFAVFKNGSGDVVSTVTATTNDVSQSFVVPENATQLFINIYKEYLADMLVYKGLEYSEGFKLTNLKIDYENVLNSPKFNNQWAGKNGVTFGDSITWYDGKPFISSHTENGVQAVGYQTYLRNDLDVSIDNRGVGGNNATQILNTVKSYDFTNTDFATLTSGANDWSQERAIGTLASPKSTFNENTFYGAIQSAVEYMLNQNDNMKIILITPMRGYHPISTHTGDWVNDTTVDGMLQTPRAYRKAIMDIAELYGLEVIDFYDGLGLNFLNYTEYLGDDPTQTSGKYVHPNNKFYEIVGKYAVNAFRNLTI